MKALIEQAIESGKQGFARGLKLAPALNTEFMATVPNCIFGDNKGVKLRIKMYEAYIKGFTIAMLSS